MYFHSNRKIKIHKCYFITFFVDGNIDIDFDDLGKKKKKKKVTINLDDLEKALPNALPAEENGSGLEDAMDVSFIFFTLKGT